MNRPREWLQRLRTVPRGHVRYKSLAGGSANSSIWSEKGRASIAWSTPVRRGVFALIAATTAFLLILLTAASLQPQLPPTTQTPPAGLETPHYLRLLLPATSPQISLCKSSLSAAALAYTPPTILNWASRTNTSLPLANRLRAVQDHLRNLRPENDDDVVVLVNSPDLIFQLRPSVLLGRWYDINALAEARTRRQLGAGMDEGVNQTIVFSARADCSQGTAHAACDASPKVARGQQRHLSSALVVGRVQPLRHLITHALEKLDALDGDARGFDTEDDIFTSIHAEQEAQRLCIRARHLTPVQEMWKSLTLGLRLHAPPPPPDCLPGVPLDYGISIDHSGLLSTHLPPTYTSSPKNTTRPSAFPLDISTSPSPFHALRPTPNLPSPTTPWHATPLHTHPSLPHIIPATLLTPLSHVWSKTWFHTHLGPLLSLRAHEPWQPITVQTGTQSQKRGQEVLWGEIVHGTWDERGGVFVDSWEGDGGFVPWKEVCEGVWGEVFGED